MGQNIILGLAIGLSLGSTLVWGLLIFRGLVRVPPGRFLAIQRSNSADPAAGPLGFAHSGRMLVIPLFQSGQLYPSEFPEIKNEALRITHLGNPLLDCSLTLGVKLIRKPEPLTRFVQTLGGLGLEEIVRIVRIIAENGTHQVLASLPVDRSLSAPDQAKARLWEHLDEELGSVGLQVGELALVLRPVHAPAHRSDDSEFSMDRVLEKSPFGD
ncbi:hypothetical protein KKD52_17210 [Myxococcota bacterium]|nr:hypothetical protein [Myxococcota bacterium]MBU1512094.1 hypothetical protein [Myxococcota bacterium]